MNKKPFLYDVKYIINFKLFMGELLKHSDKYYSRSNPPVAIDQFEIVQILKNDDFSICAVLESVTQNKKLFLRLVKKWNSYNSMTNDIRSYEMVFSKFQPISDHGFVGVELILEHAAFLAIVSEFYEKSSLFDLIYHAKPVKTMLTENAVYSMVKQLLECIESTHQRKGVLLCIKPEQIFIKSAKKIVLSHLTRFKLDFNNFVENAVFESPEYMPPEFIGELKEVGPGIDFWALGILM